jgi:hypothetical protein
VNAFKLYKQLEYPGDVLVKMYGDPGRTTFETGARSSEWTGVISAAGCDHHLGEFSPARGPNPCQLGTRLG